jgi:hypothetical protein
LLLTYSDPCPPAPRAPAPPERSLLSLSPRSPVPRANLLVQVCPPILLPRAPLFSARPALSSSVSRSASRCVTNSPNLLVQCKRRRFIRIGCALCTPFLSPPSHPRKGLFHPFLLPPPLFPRSTSGNRVHQHWIPDGSHLEPARRSSSTQLGPN